MESTSTDWYTTATEKNYASAKAVLRDDTADAAAREIAFKNLINISIIKDREIKNSESPPAAGEDKAPHTMDAVRLLAERFLATEGNADTNPYRDLMLKAHNDSYLREATEDRHMEIMVDASAKKFKQTHDYEELDCVFAYARYKPLCKNEEVHQNIKGIAAGMLAESLTFLVNKTYKSEEEAAELQANAQTTFDLLTEKHWVVRPGKNEGALSPAQLETNRQSTQTVANALTQSMDTARNRNDGWEYALYRAGAFLRCDEDTCPHLQPEQVEAFNLNTFAHKTLSAFTANNFYSPVAHLADDMTQSQQTPDNETMELAQQKFEEFKNAKLMITVEDKALLRAAQDLRTGLSKLAHPETAKP